VRGGLSLSETEAKSSKDYRMFYTNIWRQEMKTHEGSAKVNLPLDVRVVVWLALISAGVGFLFFTLLLLGFAHHPPGYERRVFLGTFCVGSDLASSIYTFLMATACLACAYGLAKRHKLGWWFALTFSFYNIADALFGSPDFPVSTGIAICFGLITITWLLVRRRLYHIGDAREKEATDI